MELTQNIAASPMHYVNAMYERKISFEANNIAVQPIK